MLALFENWHWGEALVFFTCFAAAVVAWFIRRRDDGPVVLLAALLVFGTLGFFASSDAAKDRVSDNEFVLEQVTAVFGGEDFKGMAAEKSGTSTARIDLPDGCAFTAKFHEWEDGTLVLVTGLTRELRGAEMSLERAVPPIEARRFVLMQCFPK